MTDIELYREIGLWIRAFHTRDFYYSQLLKDFQHDIFIKLRGKELNREYVKIVCRYHPWELMKNRYGRRMKSHCEFVPLDNEGDPYLEFADNSFNPEYEFPPPPKPKLKHHKDTRRLRVTYRNGEEEEFDSVKELAEDLNFKEHRTLYRYIGKPLSERFTKRKMSHIKIINYAESI